MNPHLFTALAAPFILSSAMLFAWSNRKKLALILALIGGSLFMAGGIVYRDYSIIIIETCFITINTIGLCKALK